MKNILFILITIVTFFFTSCKKEEVSDVGSQNIVLVKFAPQQLPPDTNSTKYLYKISGSIIAPKNVKMKDYGFVFTPTAGEPNIINFGSGIKLGYIETIVSSDAPILSENVEFFIILESGEYLSSEDKFTQPFNIIANPPSHNYTNPFEVFYCTVNNNDNSNLQIIEQGINYMPTIPQGGDVPKIFNQTGLTDNKPTYNMMLNVQLGEFVSGKDYTYFVYFLVKNINTGEIQNIQSSPSTFTAN